MPHATMTSKGQITIPRAVREALALYQGTTIEFELEKDGSARMRAKHRSLDAIIGSVATAGVHLTIEAMDPGTGYAL
ncbi:MAG: AbrB/MazE/SpoVT family DNA-binding domain-containing protein [Gemmatimonadaceae bacterium]|nr:AbrB/MazE/SpoVT family DNA-binding domain-containing protein [Gemmatimonadaceae bacterium]